jgi:peptidyl-prolyl cis-trans isomerase C
MFAVNLGRWIKRIALLGLLLSLTACDAGQEASAEPAGTGASPAATQRPPTPTTTPVPLAAQVNGERITMAAYQAELARYKAAAGTEMATDEEKAMVIEDMVDQLLLAQAALEAGFVVDNALLQSHIEQMEVDEAALVVWMEANAYTEESFREAFARSIAAAWMRDQIIAEVAQTAEQVHARQILLYNSEDAEDVLDQLNSGADFETLAAQYDPLTSGDLGWFPQGYLTVPELDDYVFDLAPGEYSPVIETMLGYHIVQVIEYDAERPLSSNAFRHLQAEKLTTWLQNRRAQSEIEVYVP